MMKGLIINGNDILEVYETITEAKKYVIENGPILIESKTYRWLGHSKSDANVYRTKEEIAEWKAKDPIAKMKNYLLDNKVLTEKEVEDIEAKIKEDIELAVEFARNSPFPSLDTILDDVYV